MTLDDIETPAHFPSSPYLHSNRSGRYASQETSLALPFLKRPTALDGSHAGDAGFDPLGFTKDVDLYTLQEAELRHARLAMLAVVGWPASEMVAPDFMLQEGGRAPSVLNGFFGQDFFNPLPLLATIAVFAGLGYFEYTTALRKIDDKELGKIHRLDMQDVWKYGVAGD
jgi:Chlorophyll A-B binding protein